MRPLLRLVFSFCVLALLCAVATGQEPTARELQREINLRLIKIDMVRNGATPEGAERLTEQAREFFGKFDAEGKVDLREWLESAADRRVDYDSLGPEKARIMADRYREFRKEFLRKRIALIEEEMPDDQKAGGSGCLSLVFECILAADDAYLQCLNEVGSYSWCLDFYSAYLDSCEAMLNSCDPG